jgi:adenosine deaminase
MTRDELKAMPKGEFHLHLEGSLPYSLLKKVDPEKYASLPPYWDKNYRFPDFSAFDWALLSMAGDWFTSVERYHMGAKAVFDDAREQGIRYLETSIASGCLEFGSLDLSEVCATIKSAVPDDMEVRLFLGIHHSGYSGTYAPIINEGLDCPHLDGLDLHGNESDPLDNWAADLYKRAREKGKYTKCHAGEFMGPDFIRRAVNELGTERIEHGVRAVEDSQTMKLLADKAITLDICPVSNVKLQVASSYEAHPLRKLVDGGVKCTINRDDPLLFGSTLEEEYYLVQNKMGFTDKEIFELVRNGFETALLSPEKKKALNGELDEFIRANFKNNKF